MIIEGADRLEANQSHSTLSQQQQEYKRRQQQHNHHQQQQHEQRSSSSMSRQSRSRRTSASTIISPRTRGNAIARALASPGDLLHDEDEYNLDNSFTAGDDHDTDETGGGGGGNDNDSREAAGRRRNIQHKFISPSKRSTAEATLNCLARRRTTSNSSDTVTAASAAAAAKQSQAPPHTSITSLTTPGGRRRKRKAACDAQSKLRDICEMEDFDHLDELLTDSSQKIPYNGGASASTNHHRGRTKRTRMNGGDVVGARVGAVVSDIVVVADRSSIASPAAGTTKNCPDPHILSATAHNNTVDTAALASFVPKGKVEERWFRNFKKWRCNSSSTATTTNAPSLLAATPTMPSPTSPPPKLWIREQRVQYNLWKQDKNSKMTKERIDLLESAGFCWEGTERRQNGKGVATAAAAAAKTIKNVTASKMNPGITERDRKEHVLSKDAHQTGEENPSRQSVKRKSPREDSPTQFYLNLGEGTDATNNNQSQLVPDSTASETSTSTNPPKNNRKKERRGRHSMSTLEALDVPADTSLSSDVKGGIAATKRSKSLSYKELDMAVSKSLQQKARKRANAKKSSEKKIEDKPLGERKVDENESTETTVEADVPMINCNDLSPSLESPLLVTTILPTISSPSQHHDPQTLPVTAAANTTEPLCVRKLMLSCLSDESPHDGSETISSRSIENPKSSSNGCSTINDGNTSIDLMNPTGGAETSKQMMDVSVSVERDQDEVIKSRTIGDTSKPHSKSLRPVTRLEAASPDIATNGTDPGSHSNQRLHVTSDSRSSIAPSEKEACVGSPWEHDDDDFASTTVDFLLNSPDQSHDGNNPRRLFSSPVGDGTQSQTLIPPANIATRKETGTQTADPSSQPSDSRKVGNNLNEAQTNIPSHASPTYGVNNDECSLGLFSPLSPTSPFGNAQQSHSRMHKDCATNTDSVEAELANPSSRSLDSSRVPEAMQPIEPSLPLVMVENKYQHAVTNYGQLEIEMKLVAQRMREIEAKMKLVDSSSIPNNSIESERDEYSSNKLPHRSSSRSTSARQSHHLSSNYYESSEEEYNDDYYPPSPIRQRRSWPQEMTRNRSSRASDTHNASVRRDRSRSNHDDRRNGRSSYVSDVRKKSNRRPKRDERYYYSHRSDLSDDSIADNRNDRYHTNEKIEKRLGRKSSQESETKATTSSKSHPHQKQKRRHPVSVLETASPSKPALAEDPSEDERSHHSGQSSAGKPEATEKVNAELSVVVQRNDATDDQETTPTKPGNESNERFSYCALGGRARQPMFWLSRKESSSDDESWDFDGPMILPPPPL
jgi:hypothetical protein